MSDPNMDWVVQNAPSNGGYVRNPEDAVDIRDLVARNPQAFAQDPRGFLASQGAVLPDVISLADAKTKAAGFSKSIFANWNLLTDILDRHEAAIRTRWGKKSGKNRRQVLSDVWPKISEGHRPEWKAMTAAADERGLEGPIKPPDPRYRDTFLLPNINLEDLSTPKSLLVLLNSRARNEPHVFAFSDYLSVRLGVHCKCINPEMIEEDGVHKMKIIGHSSPTAYGEIYPLSKGQEPYRGAGDVEPGVGLIILEAQDRILDFLVGCAKRILHEVPEGELLGEVHPVQQPLPPLARENASEAVTIPSLSEEGPYHVPHAMDFDALLTLIEAKRSECEDNMWALREDPGYFAEMALSRAEHRQESVLDIHGKEHPFKGTPLFWDRILTNLVAEAYSYLMSWTVVREYVKRIKALHIKHADSLSIDKPLPAELEIELLAYQQFIELMQETPMLQLNSAVPGSPELRNDWWRDLDYPDENVCFVKTKTPVLYDYLLMLFTILADQSRREYMGLQNILDEIERTIRRDPKQKARISPMVAHIFSDLALTGELDRQLRMYQPRLYEPFYHKNAGLSRDVSKSVMKNMGSIMQVAEYMDEMRIAEEGTPKGNRLNYPIDQPRTKETMDKMHLAEIKLDKFWVKVDKFVLTRARKPWQNGMTLHVLNPAITAPTPRILHRTPAWTEETKQPKGAKAPSAAELRYQLELRTQRTIGTEGKPTSRSKGKTRGVAKPQPTADAEAVEVPPPEPREQVFTVNKRVHKVFTALFYSPTNPDRPGEIVWQDFLHAMAATGFVFEKLYGSVWQFTPTQLDIERAINFHEPHPEKKMPYRMARRYGGRLARAYGWGAGTFRLE